MLRTTTKNVSIIAWAVLLGMIFVARRASAIGLGDVADHLPRVVLLRSAARAIAGGASSGFRKEATQFINNSINPLLDRVDTILRLRIDQAAGEAAQLLDQAERSLNAIIEHAGLVADREINTFFQGLTAALDGVTTKVDVILTDALCKIAPEGKGILVNFALLPRADELRVLRPRWSQCWSVFPQSQNDPWWYVFSGWQSYKGQICEAEFAINAINPESPHAIAEVAESYSYLVGLAAQAQCYAKSDVDKTYLMTKRYEFEQKTEFFHALSGE